MLSSLRLLAPLGRNAGVLSECSQLVTQTIDTQVRSMAAAAPSMTLDAYVTGIRTQIAAAYEDRAIKYDEYITKFEDLITTSGVPRANDFDSVANFAAKRAQILQQVNFPADWKATAAEAEAIQTILKNIPAEKKEPKFDLSKAAWYHNLTDAQIAQCAKNPTLFMELEKVQQFEDRFAALSKAIATKYDLPPINIADLPAKLDLKSEHSISAAEVKWIAEKAKARSEHLRKTEPRFADPFNTQEFKDLQKTYAEKFGIDDAQLAKLQSEWTPAMWKAKSIKLGIRV